MTNQDLENIIREVVKEKLILEITTKTRDWEPRETRICLRWDGDAKPFTYETLNINIEDAD